MRNPARFFSAAASAIVIVGSLSAFSTPVLAQEQPKQLTPVEEGKKIAFDRRKGNCLACHAIAGGDLAGNIAPPLVAMQARFPDKAKLRAQIYDARTTNSHTAMPPYGAYKILTESELDKVVEYIYTL